MFRKKYRFDQLGAAGKYRAINERKRFIEEQGIGDTDEEAIIRGFDLAGSKFDVYGILIED